MVVPDLLDHLRAAFNPHSTITYDNLFEQVRTAPLLIRNRRPGNAEQHPWAQEKLFNLSFTATTPGLPPSSPRTNGWKTSTRASAAA